MLKLIFERRPALVVFEGYALGGRTNSRLGDLAELGGALKMAIWPHGIPMLVVPPATMKLVITGKGNAKKPEIAAALLKNMKVEIDDEDAADAVGLLLCALSLQGRKVIPLTEKQRTSLTRCATIEARKL